MVWEAYKKVRAKGKSAGIDGISLKEFKQDHPSHLYKIWNRLSSGSYFPPAVREEEITKKDGKVRKLGIPTVGDRVAQMVIKNLIESRLEQVFHDNSYGYRLERSAHDALAVVRQNVRIFPWVIDLDIKGFFDNIDHELLMQAIERHVDEPWIIMYIRRWLEMPIQTKGGDKIEKQGKGTPQGGVISPILANLFLHYVFDEWLRIYYPQVKFVRYADDAIIHCRTKEEAEEVLQSLHKRVGLCKLELHKDKTKIVYCKDYRRTEDADKVSFDFLGYCFQPRSSKSKRTGKMFLGFDLAISKSSRTKLIEELRSTKFHLWTTATIEEIATQLNSKLSGWIQYYGKFRRWELSGVFRRFHERLIKWLLNKYKRLKGSIKKAYKLLENIKKTQPTLFAHWKAGYSI